jgi:Sec-independent protein translocase protein TatA
MSFPDMLFVGLLGLLIFGPKKLATLGQQAGETLARLKKVSSEFRSQLEAEISASAIARPAERAPVEIHIEKSPRGTG